MSSTTRDDQVEILATVLGAFILGASSAREFFFSGNFEVRIFLLGISCFILFIGVAVISETRPRLFMREKKFHSLIWLLFFVIGSGSAIDLFGHQFLARGSAGAVQLETIIFLSSYTLSTNFLYILNRDLFLKHLKQKTLYKYLLAPINGLSFGVILGGFFIWSFI